MNMETEDSLLEACETDAGCEKIWEAFNEMRMKNVLCDIKLMSGDGCSFPVHKAVLAANSRNFLESFTRKDSNLFAAREYIAQNMDSEHLEAFVDYMYKRVAHITMDNALTILKYAEEFEVFGLVEQCCVFLSTALDCKNCLEIYLFAASHNKEDLLMKSKCFILENYLPIYQKNPDFVRLSHQDLLSLISDDNLNVIREETVFESTMKWIDHNPENRIQYLMSFFSQMRLGLISIEYFVDHVSSHPYVIMEQENCESLINATWDLLYNIQNGVQSIGLDNLQVRPRIPGDVVFTLGGWSGNTAVAQFETYDSRADRWFGHKYLEENTVRAYHGVAVLDNIIYVIGGFDGFMIFNTTKKFDPVTKIWTDLSPMYSQRSYVAVAVCNGYIYAMGGKEGKDDEIRLNSVERYDPRKNQWTMITPMVSRRSDAAAESYAGQVYVFGGFNGEEHLSTVEVYCPETDHWTMCGRMAVPRSGVGVVLYEDVFYIIGGHDGQDRLSSVEKFDPVTKVWMTVKKMYTSRSNCGTAILDNMIFVMGGFNGQTTIDKVECYDPEADEWLDACYMNLNRSGFKACVLRNLPNAQQYTFHGCRGDAFRQRIVEDLVIYGGDYGNMGDLI